MLNPFFLQGSKGEQNLVQDIINEHLKMYGVDVYYLPRTYITEKTVIKEVIESEFRNIYPIEAYVENYEGYGGQTNILSKFGVQNLSNLTLIISKDRFESYIYPLIDGKSNIKLSTRPKEGDLIYFPLGQRLFEIKYVEHEKPFYQLQKNYVYELSCEMFRYGDEIIDTGIEEIDNTVVNTGFIKSFTMVGSGITATAQVLNIFNGGVRFVTVTNRGFSYKTNPNVAFELSPELGGTASGIATMISGIVDFCEPNGDLLRVQGVELTNSGFGYTVAPRVVFSGGGGNGAEAVSTIGNGVVGVISVTNGGSGYIIPPLVSFTSSNIGIITAKAVSVLGANGSIQSIRIVDAGVGYTTIPQIVIESPYTQGFGNYIQNEEVIATISGKKGVVKSWDARNNILNLYKINGEFSNNDVLVGTISSASYVIYDESVYDIIDAFNDSDIIQIEADNVIDFSETNPFGMP
jgi:hypothetical protein